MRVIIGGAGRVGYALAQALSNENYDIVIVDNDARAVSRAQALDGLVIHGDVTDREVLLRAGVATAKIFIAATPSDQTNLIASAIAEHANQGAEPKKGLITICRLRSPNFIEEYRKGHLTAWAKIDHVVNPLRGAIQRLNAGLRSSGIAEVVSFDHDAYVVEVSIGPSAVNVVDRPLGDVKRDFVHGFPNIVGVNPTSGKSYIPNDDSVLHVGDKVAVAIVGLENFNPALITLGHEVTHFPDHPRVVVIGANELGQKMAEDWLSNGASVTVIERDLQLANDLAGSTTGAHPKLDVIHGDHLDRGLLSEIAIEEFHVAVSALANDHANIAAVLLASDLGVPHTGLMLTDADLVKVTQRMGISFAVDRQRVAIDNILTHVHQSMTGQFSILAEIPNVVGVTLEVTEKVAFAGQELGSADVPSHLKLGFIKRVALNGKWGSIAPKPDQLILEHDQIVLFCTLDRIKDAKKLFKVTS